MSAKLLFFCSTVLLCQRISCQYINPGIYGNNYPSVAAAEVAYANNLPYGSLAAEMIPEIGRTHNGGGLRVTSYSPIAPTGVTVDSDSLVMEGPLAVSGHMPFSGVVALEGPLPAVGQGAVAYTCGDGNVGVVRENVEGLGYANGLGVSAGLANLGYNGVANGLVNGPIY